MNKVLVRKPLTGATQSEARLSVQPNKPNDALDVMPQGFHWLFALAGFVEALVMHHADLLNALGAAQSVVRIAQTQAALIGRLGGVEVADDRELHVSMAKVEFSDGLREHTLLHICMTESRVNPSALRAVTGGNPGFGPDFERELELLDRVIVSAREKERAAMEETRARVARLKGEG